MVYTTLDIIVRRSLLEKGMPIHFYPEYLFHASSCLRQLAQDTLKLVNTKQLPVNSYLAVDLPEDFSDDLAVTIPAGNLLQPVPKRDNINPLRIHNTSDGSFTTYSDVDGTSGETVFGFSPGWLWFWNVNDYGEPTGRYFGAGGGAKANGYQVFRERKQIQLTETFTSDSIVLLYVSDGQSVDNASQVDTRAFDCIQSFIDWRTSPNAAIQRSPQGATFYNQKRRLKTLMNDLTITDLKQILHQNYKASLKS